MEKKQIYKRKVQTTLGESRCKHVFLRCMKSNTPLVNFDLNYIGNIYEGKLQDSIIALKVMAYEVPLDMRKMYKISHAHMISKHSVSVSVCTCNYQVSSKAMMGNVFAWNDPQCIFYMYITCTSWTRWDREVCPLYGGVYSEVKLYMIVLGLHVSFIGRSPLFKVSIKGSTVCF